MRTTFAALHPASMALACGVGALVLGLLGGFGMMGAGSMMGGGWMMGGYGGTYPGYHMNVAGGLFALVWIFVAGAVAGWVVASVYNAASAQATGSSTSSGTGVAAR